MVQGRHNLYKWKAICDFLLVNNTNLHPILHRFHVIMEYWSNFCCHFNTLIWGEPLSQDCKLWPQETRDTVLWCGA